METSRSGKIRLSDVYSDLFILATQLKSVRDYGDPDLLRQRIMGIFDAASRKGHDARVSEEAMDRSKYAIVAFLDEIILSSPWPQKDQWLARPLQYEFFRENVAGVEFFNRLEVLRRTATTNQDILEIYYLCLILGFEGQYKLHGQEKLKALISELSREIEAGGQAGRTLSPQGRRPDEFVEMMKQGLPAWVILVACFTIVFVFFLTLSYLGNHDAKEVSQYLTQLLEATP
ncbi:MAG: DotU family type IV/VI secretion system protein [Nitrospirae bacterium]|nr:DotU family type IV/VI secretion system protein [Candidatus Manganitrophaceae bacterium]